MKRERIGFGYARFPVCSRSVKDHKFVLKANPPKYIKAAFEVLRSHPKMRPAKDHYRVDDIWELSWPWFPDGPAITTKVLIKNGQRFIRQVYLSDYVKDVCRR